MARRRELEAVDSEEERSCRLIFCSTSAPPSISAAEHRWKCKCMTMPDKPVPRTPGTASQDTVKRLLLN